jgi:hypothetical protein
LLIFANTILTCPPNEGAAASTATFSDFVSKNEEGKKVWRKLQRWLRGCFLMPYWFYNRRYIFGRIADFGMFIIGSSFCETISMFEPIFLVLAASLGGSGR